jgi:hypothetical protein
MKTKLLLGSLLSLMAFSGLAQVENDDMYFNSGDRQKFKEARSSQVAYASTKESKIKENDPSEDVNPTDSYSARNTNPEFSARSNAESAQQDNQDYFVQNYKYHNANNLNNWNSDFNNWYGNSWYNSSYYSPGIYGWNSPYYGGYSSFSNPWYNPYFQSGWSSSFSYYYGNNWNYGWGMGYNYGCPYNGWGSPFGYSSFYSPYYGGGYGYRYPSVIIVDDNYYSRPNYSRRNSRSSYINRTQTGLSNRVSPSSYSNTGRGSRSDSGGRVSSTNNQNSRPEYYNRAWRNQTTSPSSTTDSNSSGRTRSSSWSGSNPNTNTNSSYNRSNSSSNSSYSPPSRSSSSYDGGGSRSSGSSSGSGGNSGGSGSRSSRGR